MRITAGTVTVNGQIVADGANGASQSGGGGPRIMTAVLSGTGTLDARSGDGNAAAYAGRIRVETAPGGYRFAGQAFGNFSKATLVPNPRILPEASGPTVCVTSVDGVAVPTRVTGGFAPADVVIDKAQELTLEIAARNIPLGIVVTLILVSETKGAATVTSTPLAGTLENSTATASATFASRFTRVFPSVTW